MENAKHGLNCLCPAQRRHEKMTSTGLRQELQKLLENDESFKHQFRCRTVSEKCLVMISLCWCANIRFDDHSLCGTAAVLPLCSLWVTVSAFVALWSKWQQLLSSNNGNFLSEATGWGSPGIGSPPGCVGKECLRHCRPRDVRQKFSERDQFSGAIEGVMAISKKSWFSGWPWAKANLNTFSQSNLQNWSSYVYSPIFVHCHRLSCITFSMGITIGKSVGKTKSKGMTLTQTLKRMSANHTEHSD